MPSSTAVTQAGSSLPEAPTSTTHSRQAPTSLRPSRWHRVGMSMPFSAATSRIDWPAAPATSVPSIRRVWTLMRRASARSATGQTPAGQVRSWMWARYSSRK